MGRLAGKVAIITGAAMGQGEAEARLFASEGAKVVLTDVQESLVQKVADSIIESGGQALALKHDVSNEQDWQRVIAKTVEHFGTINVLVNNAGIATNNTLENQTIDEWNRVMSINSTSVFLGMKYAVPEMRKAGGGSIINISSIAGIVGMGTSAYSASKGAIRVLTKAAAIEYAKDNIRVNSVHPGIIVTPMTKDLINHEETRKSFEAATPLPRLGKPEDIAYGVLYLASDESSFVTGIELVIDGGYIAQ
jgi:NAD(P)-dependent dehydrogenase (short-subunit alcohol dehydrogenase family)